MVDRVLKCRGSHVFLKETTLHVTFGQSTFHSGSPRDDPLLHLTSRCLAPTPLGLHCLERSDSCSWLRASCRRTDIHRVSTWIAFVVGRSRPASCVPPRPFLGGWIETLYIGHLPWHSLVSSLTSPTPQSLGVSLFPVRIRNPLASSVLSLFRWPSPRAILLAMEATTLKGAVEPLVVPTTPQTPLRLLFENS